MTDKADDDLANDILNASQSIQNVQKKIASDLPTAIFASIPEQPSMKEFVPALTDAEREYVGRLCNRYGIGVWHDDSSGMFYVSHPSMGEDTFQASTEADLYRIVCDFARDLQLATAKETTV